MDASCWPRGHLARGWIDALEASRSGHSFRRRRHRDSGVDFWIGGHCIRLFSCNGQVVLSSKVAPTQGRSFICMCSHLTHWGCSVGHVFRSLDLSSRVDASPRLAAPPVLSGGKPLTNKGEQEKENDGILGHRTFRKRLCAMHAR